MTAETYRTALPASASVFGKQPKRFSMEHLGLIWFKMMPANMCFGCNGG